VWEEFRNNGVLLRLNDVVRSWLRLLTPIDCTYWMNTKYFSSLRCCGWAYGCTLTLLRPFGWEWISGKLGHGYVLAPLGWCGWAYGCILIAILHIQVGVWPSLFPHPSWMYTKCFRYYMYRWGYGRACMMLLCHTFEAANPHWLHPTSIFDVYKVF
jgi:hypothetical protein